MALMIAVRTVMMTVVYRALVKYAKVCNVMTISVVKTTIKCQ